MKIRSFSCILFVCLSTAGTFAADVSAGFDSANKLYEQGKFADAASAYENLLQSGTASPALYFNLGNSYFKSGQLGHAIAAYRDAEKISPRDPDVRANLQFVRGQVQGSTTPPTGWQHGLSALTINEWAAFTAIVFWLWLGLWCAIQFRPAWEQSVRGFLWGGGLAVAALCAILGIAWSGASTKMAIVTVHDAMLHNGPLDESPTEATVHDGAELNVLDTQNGWLQVRVNANRVGWLKGEQVTLTSGV
jgi:tetratricopeptide (TPR) repeat protein